MPLLSRKKTTPATEAATPPPDVQTMHNQIVALGARCLGLPWMSDEYMESPASSPGEYLLAELHTGLCALGAVCEDLDEATTEAAREAGARHNRSDKAHVQAMHDSAVALGAACATATKEAAGRERESLAEAASGRQVALDAPQGDVTFVIIRPGFNSSKARFYTTEAVQRIAEGMRGRKMYVNHPTASEARERPERDLGTWVATITETWVDPQGVAWGRAAIHEADFLGRVTRLAETGLLEQLGASINVAGIGQKVKKDGVDTFLVEDIDVQDPFRSVDWVTEPGAGGRAVLLEAQTPAAAPATPLVSKETPVMSESTEKAAAPAVDPQVAALAESVARLTATLASLTRERTLDGLLAQEAITPAVRAAVRARLLPGTEALTADGVRTACEATIAEARQLLGARESAVRGLGGAPADGAAAQRPDYSAELQEYFGSHSTDPRAVEAAVRGRS